MKRFLLWSFARGSMQWDILCGMILVFIFWPLSFNDRPDFMKLSGPAQVRKGKDDDGKTVYTVKIERSLFVADRAISLDSALGRLKETIGEAHVGANATSRALYDTMGRLVAYAIWPNEDE